MPDAPLPSPSLDLESALILLAGVSADPAGGSASDERAVTERALTMARLLQDGSVARRALRAEAVPSRVLAIEDAGASYRVTYLPFSRKGPGARPSVALTDPKAGPKGGVVRVLWARAAKSIERTGIPLEAVLYLDRAGDDDVAAFVRWTSPVRATTDWEDF